MNVNWTMLKESWNVIHHAFTTFGPRILVCVLVLIGIYGVGRLMKSWVASRKKPVEKSSDIQFLEKALDDDAPRKSNPEYSYAQFQRDLHDNGLTFNEIYEKCGGVFPKKPEPGGASLGFYGPTQGLDGLEGSNGPSGQAGECPERMKELQEWFKERGKTSHVGGLVPPPPNPYPLIHKIYIRRGGR